MGPVCCHRLVARTLPAGRGDDSHARGGLGYSWAVARCAGPSIQTSILQEFTVAAVCDICAKKPGFGNNRPWSRKITKRRFDPNIQRVRAKVNGTPKRLNVCTSCLKAGKVTR
jgi:large subunit ribosomal protein L28